MNFKFGDSGDEAIEIQRAPLTAQFNPGDLDGSSGMEG